MKIHAALAKFADLCPAVPKDSENPHFRSKYASLSKIQEVIKKPMKESGIVLVHSVTVDSVTTSAICIEDGSSVSSTFPFTLGKPQENGSAVTYAKRYNTAALFNLDTDADDDGNEANKNEAKQEKPWMTKEQLNDVLTKASQGAFQGKTGKDVVAMARTKYAVNKEQASAIESAIK